MNNKLKNETLTVNSEMMPNVQVGASAASEITERLDSILLNKRVRTISAAVKGLVRLSGYYVLIIFIGVPWVLGLVLEAESPERKLLGDYLPNLLNFIAYTNLGAGIFLLSFPAAAVLDCCIGYGFRSRIPDNDTKGWRWAKRGWRWAVRITAFKLWSYALGIAFLLVFASSFR